MVHQARSVPPVWKRALGGGACKPVNDVGKPCAREAHARFDGRGLETEPSRATAPVPDPTEYRAALFAFDRAYSTVGEFTAGLSRADLLAFSRCRGWVVADVLFHVLCDAQRALVALASPAPGPPDRDFVSYWTAF